MGAADDEQARRAKETRKLQLGDDRHHAEQQGQRAKIDRLERLVERDRAADDHRRGPDQGDSGPVEPRERQLSDGDAAIGREENGGDDDSVQGQKAQAKALNAARPG